jgi:hypothetical protein
MPTIPAIGADSYRCREILVSACPAHLCTVRMSIPSLNLFVMKVSLSLCNFTRWTPKFFVVFLSLLSRRVQGS